MVPTATPFRTPLGRCRLLWGLLASACASADLEQAPATTPETAPGPVHDVVVTPTAAPATPSAAEKGFALSADNAKAVVYINGGGADVVAGRDNAALGGPAATFSRAVSSIADANARLQPPRIAANSGAWSQLMDAIRRYYAPYGVLIVDQEPTRSGYMEVIVTSSPASAIGLDGRGGLGGIAVSRCGLFHGGVGFVFEGAYPNANELAIGATHETGHLLSLTHMQTPNDLMSYQHASPKRFVDTDARCGVGPGQTEPCNCGGSTQNSHRQLLRLLGPNPGTATGAIASGGATTTGGVPGQGVSSRIRIVTPAPNAQVPSGSSLRIEVDVSAIPAPRGVVTLLWTRDGTIQEIPCENRNDGLSCQRLDPRYIWQVPTGTGSRSIRARIAGSSGAVEESEQVDVELIGG